MIEIYMGKGLSKEDATSVITTMAKYKDFFVDVMMQQELELQVRRRGVLIRCNSLGSSTLTRFPKKRFQRKIIFRRVCVRD
jgi:hypothetical protein